MTADDATALFAAVNEDMAALRAENDALRARAEAAELRLALSKPLYSRRKLEAENAALRARLAPIEALARQIDAAALRAQEAMKSDAPYRTVRGLLQELDSVRNVPDMAAAILAAGAGE